MSKSHSRKGKFRKVGQNLYRYSSNEIYYAVFRFKGKLKWVSLKTTDKALAKRRLAEELKKSERVDPRFSKMTLEALLAVYKDTIQTLDKKTIRTRESIKKQFEETWKLGLQLQIKEITSADLKTWLGQHRNRLKKSSYNEYVRFLKQLFQLAVDKKSISESPASEIVSLTRESPIRETPTWEQFQAIIAEIRSKKFNAEAEESADVCEFYGLAGVGMAEANNLLGEHVDLQGGIIRLFRSKTDTGFTIPIFPRLRPFLERLKEKGRLQTGEKVFLVRDPKKALKAACTRLKLPGFSSRALRRCGITKAIECGVDFKTISSWQGHRDGGVLIAKTYSYLRNEHSDNMAKLMT